MKILLIAEHDNQIVFSSTLATLSAATELSSDIDLFVMGFQCDEMLKYIKALQKIKKIIFLEASCFKQGLAEDIAASIVKIAPNYDYVLMSASTFGKNCLPRAAALCDVSMISDIVKIINLNTFVRPIYAGNALEIVYTEEKIKFLTIRSSAFHVDEKALFSDSEVPIEKLEQDVTPYEKNHFIGRELTKLERPKLENARIVVSGGRGLQNKENFKLIEQLADKLGAAVGASRAAVDAGFISNDSQVGQTGKIVAPELYIAIGISGAIQHLAGMKESKVVVAINKDPDAPIFKVADYGFVGDLFEIIPQLLAEL